MKKILFACDLDNTLIHSYKKRQKGDICIEWIGEKEQGFIHENALEKLAEITKKVEFVPITTRSVEQYLRIKWPKEVAPEYAITTNGALLLHNGIFNKKWKTESEEILKKYKEELQRVLELLTAEEDYICCRLVDSMFVFAYFKDGIDSSKIVDYYTKKTIFRVIASGKKIYFFPKEFNKGNALKRLKKLLLSDYTIAAGDSEIDIPMLEAADVAFWAENGITSALLTKVIQTTCDR